MPVFPVPCPAALVTAGLLVASTDVPRLALAIPCLWALIGSPAAFALGIRADLALLAAPGVLAIDSLVPGASRGETRWRPAS